MVESRLGPGAGVTKNLQISHRTEGCSQFKGLDFGDATKLRWRLSVCGVTAEASADIDCNVGCVVVGSVDVARFITMER